MKNSKLSMLPALATMAALLSLASTLLGGCDRLATSEVTPSAQPPTDSGGFDRGQLASRLERDFDESDGSADAPPPELKPLIVKPDFDRPYRGFGSSVAVSDTLLAVGFPTDDIPMEGGGSVCLFERQGDRNWSHAHTLRGEGITRPVGFAHHVALGNQFVAVTAYMDPGRDYSGAVYIFEPDDQGKYRQTAKLYPSDAHNSQGFGSSIAAYEDRLIVGAYQDEENGSSAGAAYIFERGPAGEWVQQAKLIGNDTARGNNLGEAVAIFRDHAAVSSRHHLDGQGCVYIFRRDEGGKWEQEVRLQSPTEEKYGQFGKALAVHSDAILVGHWNSNAAVRRGGQAHLFLLNDRNEWNIGETIRSDRPIETEHFGFSVAISETQVAVGTYANVQEKRGDTIYVFERKAGAVALQHRLTSQHVGISPFFGTDVALADTVIAVGDSCYQESPADEEEPRSRGAVLLYDLSATE